MGAACNHFRHGYGSLREDSLDLKHAIGKSSGVHLRDGDPGVWPSGNLFSIPGRIRVLGMEQRPELVEVCDRSRLLPFPYGYRLLMAFVFPSL